jgi:hypothetical protein
MPSTTATASRSPRRPQTGAIKKATKAAAKQTSTESKKKSNIVELVAMPNGKISCESLTKFFESHGCTVEAKTGGSKVYFGRYASTQKHAVYLRKSGDVWVRCARLASLCPLLLVCARARLHTHPPHACRTRCNRMA